VICNVRRPKGVWIKMENTFLSRSVTVADYRQFEENKEQEIITDFILARFTERYIRPLRSDNKHGFCTMAISCLMIEALVSFWKGWPDTIGKSKKAFKHFFKRCAQQNSELAVFSDCAEDFYENVRCGILHQAETTGGWRILREGPLFEPAEKMINATRFHNEIEKALQRYGQTLKDSDWSGKDWVNLRKKMEAVISNCSTG